MLFEILVNPENIINLLPLLKQTNHITILTKPHIILFSTIPSTKAK